MAPVTGLVPELSILHVLYQELQSKFTMPDKSYIQYGAGYVITKSGILQFMACTMVKKIEAIT